MSASKKLGPALGAAELRALAVQAQVDPRTVRKLLEGREVQPMPRQRIERALREAGRENLLPSEGVR